MGAQLIFSLILLVQVTPAPVATSPPPSTTVQTPKSADVTPTNPPVRCDARPYQRLVGRTMADLLTARVPPNTRIYRVDDPQTGPVQSGRLSVEISRNTRVRRVYCS
jgi:hypothetical protein